jgi:WD40 repeat protein
VKKVIFSPDGTLLASTSISEALLWSVTTRTQTTILAEGLAPGPETIYTVAFQPDSALVAVSAGDERHEIRLWSVKAGKWQDTLECDGRVTTATFSPDGTILACGTVNGVVELWNLASHEKLVSFKMEADDVRVVTFSPGGKTIAAQGSNSIRLWNVSTGMEIPIPQAHCSFVSNAAFNVDGSLLTYGRYCPDSESGFVELDDTTSGKQLFRSKINGSIVNYIIFSPNGTMLASATGAGITFWAAK